ncbi:unnamed protein product [Brassica rapa subsp. trilocularis]
MGFDLLLINEKVRIYLLFLYAHINNFLFLVKTLIIDLGKLRLVSILTVGIWRDYKVATPFPYRDKLFKI